MNRAAVVLLFPSLLLAADPTRDHDDSGHSAHLPGSAHHPHLENDRAERGWFHLRPHLNAAIALGGSTSEKNFGLVGGGHAPIDDGFNVQGIEVGAVMEFGEAVSLHANHNLFWDRFDRWDSEWEEAYVAMELPGEVVLRGGQFFAPFGYENTLHLHDRQFVEPPISMIRLLGEEGLVIQGAEFAWTFPGTGDRLTLRLGYGQSQEHAHGATRELRRKAYLEAVEHAGETEAEEEEEEHHHGHGLAGNGGVYDAEDAYLGEGFFFGRVEAKTGSKAINRAGLSFAAGQNGFDRTTWTAGADVQGGDEIGGLPVWWQGELFYRAVEARDEAGNQGDFDELGLYLASGLEFAKKLDRGQPHRVGVR